MKRTNIMLTDNQHSMLKTMARKEGRTLGEKIRIAIDQLYEVKDPVLKKKEVALRAYEEGFISLGRLAEVLGLDPVSAREYLKEKGIKIRVQDKKEILGDLVNA
jgi:predicted HTH domain antitoxin